MDLNNRGRIFRTFVKVFVILFVILIIMPLIIEQAMHSLNNGIIPRDNSTIVFKDMVREKEVISRFLEALKKIRNFM